MVSARTLCSYFTTRGPRTLSLSVYFMATMLVLCAHWQSLEPGSAGKAIEMGFVRQIWNWNICHVYLSFPLGSTHSEFSRVIEDRVRVVRDSSLADFVVRNLYHRAVFTTTLRIANKYGFKRFSHTLPAQTSLIAGVIRAASLLGQHVEISTKTEWVSDIHIEFVPLKKPLDKYISSLWRQSITGKMEFSGLMKARRRNIMGSPFGIARR